MSDISLSADVDTSGVAAGMASIENQVQRTANSIGSKISGLFSAGAIAAELSKILDFAETIHRESARFGVDAEKLQVVSNAAKQLGLDIGTVARGMNLLEINAQKALDPTSKQALAMEGLNISAKAFAALSVDQKFFALADAYQRSAQDGQAYADVAELIGRRNTEMIPLLAKGAEAIQAQGAALGVMSEDTVRYLAETKQQWNTFSNQFLVLMGMMLKKGQDFEDMMERIALRAHNLLFGYSGNWFQPGGGSFGGKGAGSSWGAPSSGGGVAPTDITDIAGGGVTGSGGGSVSAIEEATLRRTLNLSDRLNELLSQRVELQNKLDVAMAAGDTKAATQYQLQLQLAKIDAQILPLKQQIALEEQKGVDAADRQIEKSANRVAIDELDLQISDLRNKGNEYGAFLLESQRNLLQINLDFDEKIQAAIDKANEARAKGLELTAQENEALAQQLETERQAATALEEQRQAQERQRIAQGPNPLTIGALASGNLRLGATSDVFAAALAASRGIKPGSDEYNRLVQQITAQDQLRELQGKNLSFADQLARDKVVQWYAAQQQQQATGAAQQSHQQEIAYWQAVASGQPVPAGNPYSAMFGIPNFNTGLFTAPTSSEKGQIAIDKLQSQITLLEKAVSALDQIQQNTTLVRI